MKEVNSLANKHHATTLMMIPSACKQMLIRRVPDSSSTVVHARASAHAYIHLMALLVVTSSIRMTYKVSPVLATWHRNCSNTGDSSFFPFFSKSKERIYWHYWKFVKTSWLANFLNVAKGLSPSTEVALGLWETCINNNNNNINKRVWFV